MIGHYLSTAIRHFRRHRFTTAINVACLALGLACFVLAWGTAEYHGRSDHYQTRAERTYFLTAKSTRPGDTTPTLTIASWVVAETLRADFPELEVARVLAPPTQEAMPVNVDGVANFVRVGFADREFLRIFDLPFVAGDPRGAFAAPRSAIVSRALAQRLFGTEQVLGRQLRLHGRETVTITGVIDRIPAPSHMTTAGSTIGVYFEALVSMDTYLADLTATATDGGQAITTGWRSNWFYTYLLLPADGSLTAEVLNEKLRGFADRHVPALDGPMRFTAQPIGRFWETMLNMIAGTDRTGISSTTLLRMLGALVLLVACLNYANLATAQAATRAKEVALQRIVGARRRQILLQNLFEGALLTTVSLGIAVVAILVAVAALSEVTSDLVRVFVAMPQIWFGALALIAVVGAVASAYPALMVAGVRPADALQRAKVKSGPRFVATVLVGLQFGGASLLLITVMVMGHQQQELRDAVLAQTADPVIVIANNVKSAGVDARVLRAELERGPGVLVTSGIARSPWMIGASTVTLAQTDQPGAAVLHASLNIVDYDFFTALGIERIAGRDFARDRGLDVADLAKWSGNEPADFAVMLDRTYAQRLGFDNPHDAIGKTLYSETSNVGATPPQRLTIIGVVADSTHVPLSGGIHGNLYLLNPAAATVPVVRVSRAQLSAALAHVDSVWRRLAPNAPLVRHFADEQFDLAFSALESVRKAFVALALFAALIASMGLVGMALHVTRRRVHEIGVRKTLGASVPQILIMLLRNFSKPVLIANIAIWPLVYVLMRGYLSIFSHSVGLTPTPFLLSLGVTLAIAWAAVAVQATRAARLQPAHVLRYE